MLVQSPSDWVTLPVPPALEQRAQAIRAERDSRYANLYAERSTDVRWIGDLGELALLDWLCSQTLRDVQWLTDDAAGKADFIIDERIALGAKTVKRKVEPRLDYTAQVTARHANEPSDWFFFMNYSLEQRKLWLLGAIEAERFLKEATYYGPGSQVHGNYTIRPGHEIMNLELTRLVAPAHWARQVLH